ncbi:peptidoglycan-binding protein [Streptomyces sp. NBC_00878]|uniref:peptidoglycan-binding protein n=1 Tax=Streptomyces sp. NBC_00878 TaxID=2975854 RepID=UPI002253F73A|nr:peptidoglycan-binding protein [Streptomyces sp. NBC_00878]MCX4911186.1 peptidoglycan-binding protein [Streptomyces sp. NBC_00878]
MAGAEPEEGTEPDRRRTGRRQLLAVVAVLVVAGAAGGVVVSRTDNGERSAAAAKRVKVETALVARADLADTQEMNGTLGFGTERPFTGAKAGTVTWLPASGDTITRGRTLYKVDDRPVPVFFGATPLFRTLDKPGQTGSDVVVVAQNLRALGYDIDRIPGADSPLIDDGADRGRFTTMLAAALKRWQKQVGMKPTGRLEAGDVAVLPGQVRVGALSAQLGADAKAALMTLTSTAKAVTVPVAATEIGTVRKGTRVTVVLPDGKQTKGRVERISRIAVGGGQDDGGQGGGLQDGGAPKLDVTVLLSDTVDVRALDSAAVRVRFTTQTRKGVLTVPVGALVALSEGGYALQRPDGRLIAVETGMFARGLVEVRGEGLTSGTRVVVAS